MPIKDNVAAVLPQDCTDMAGVRAQIDRVDRALVALVAERLGYIARAAVLKPHRSAVHDDSRIEDVVAKVRARAEALGAPPDFVEGVWRELIARSIAREFALFDERHARAGIGSQGSTR